MNDVVCDDDDVDDDDNDGDDGDDDDGKACRFHIARQPPPAASFNIQSSISLSIDIVLKFEYPIFAVYNIHCWEINNRLTNSISGGFLL